jgi:hypothetical protein
MNLNNDEDVREPVGRVVDEIMICVNNVVEL